MKKTLALLAILVLAPAFATAPAEAGIFSVNVAFDVGGFYFDLGFGGPHYESHHGHYVYRVSEPIHHAGYQCHSGCYRTGGYTYHHAECPLVAYHFRSYGFSPYVAYPSFFATHGYRDYRSYRGHRSYRSYRTYRPYRSHGRYVYRDQRRYYDRYRHHRYDRRDRSRHEYRSRRHHTGPRRDRGIDRRGHRSEDLRRDQRGRDIRRRDAGSTRSRGGNRAPSSRDGSRGRGRR